MNGSSSQQAENKPHVAKKAPKLNLDNAIYPSAEEHKKPEIAKVSNDAARAANTDIVLYDSDGKKKSQATLLIEIGQQSTLFHDENQDAYAEVKIDGISIVYKIRSRDYREYLGHKLYKLIDKGANATAITDAVNTLEAAAKHDGELKTVAIRVFHDNDSHTVYIDQGCSKRKIVKIDRNGLEIVTEAHVKFIRKNGMTELSQASDSGDIGLIRKYINVCEEELPLVYGWLFCALAGVKPYPILILQGEQGTGKSTTSRVIRLLVDPSSVLLRNPPRDSRDLMVSAANTHCVVLDNLSGLSPELADCMCRLSTGGGIDVRALYTDSEQFLIDLQRPILCNGIDDIATRPDLADRSFIINLPVISNKERKSELEFWQSFEKDRPKIQAALYRAISSGLKFRDQIKLTEKPRMADVVQWVTACERGLNMEGAFINAHTKNQMLAVELGIDSSPIGSAVMALMSDRKKWIGKPTEFMAALEDIAGERQVRSKAWPQSPKGLNNAIKRLMPNFRKMGIEIIKYDFGNREYRIENLNK
jgi:hypothetical protein